MVTCSTFATLISYRVVAWALKISPQCKKFTNKNPTRNELKINFNFKFWNEPLDYPN
jgi:hypothetical protein